MKKNFIIIFSVVILILGVFALKKINDNKKEKQNVTVENNVNTVEKNTNNVENTQQEELTLEKLRSQKKPIILDFSKNG